MLDTQATNMLADLEPGQYRFDPQRSSVRVKVTANWGLQRVRATFQIPEGSLRVTEDRTLSEVSAVIDPATFSSRNEKRDRHIMSADFLDVSRYPKISFTGGRTRSHGDALILTGSITIHGKTESVDVRVVKASMEGEMARFEATAHLERDQFDVSHMPRRVGRAVELSYDVAATRV